MGGSSKRHQWNEDKVFASIEHIVKQHPNNEIIITTSRRTPEQFVERLNTYPFLPHVHFFPVEQTPQGWIFEEMQQAEAVWVTEDSVSMIYEALTAGCRVGVIAMDRTKQDRITTSVDGLLEKGIISESLLLAQLPEPNAFKEAERVATYLLAQ